MVKEHVTVAIGGEELFGGYNPYQFAPRVWGKLKIMPLPLREIAFGFLSGLPLPDKLEKLLSVFPARDREHFIKL